MFKNLMTICSLFESQISTSFQKIPKNIKIFIHSKKKKKKERKKENIFYKYKLIFAKKFWILLLVTMNP